MNSGNCQYIKYWEEKGAKKNFSTPFQQEIFERQVNKDAVILDVGCGYGRLMVQLIESGFENVKGVEPSETLRERGLEQNSSLNIFPLRNGKISFGDNSFDAVLLVAVLTCVPDNAEQLALINEIHRVLKPGGIIYINDFLLNNDQRNLDRYKEYEGKHNCYGIFELEGGGVLRHFTEQHVNDLLNNFQLIESQKVVYTTMNGNKSNGFYYIGRK